jgi:aminopeptidase N
VSSAGKTIETVWLKNEHDSFTFPSTEAPLLVRFDEGNWLLKEWTYPKSTDELLYQSRNDDVIGREWAVRQLGQFTGERIVSDALEAIVSDDPFWAVRLAAVEAVSSVEVLRAAAEDGNSQVRRAAIRKLSEVGDSTLVEFFCVTFDADSSYQVQAEALRAIGRNGDRGQLGFLRQAAEMKSPRDVIRNAAEWAIEEITKPR